MFITYTKKWPPTAGISAMSVSLHGNEFPHMLRRIYCKKIISHSAFIVLLHTFLYLPPPCTHTAGFQIREFAVSVVYFSLSSQLIFSWGLVGDRRFLSLQSSVLGKDRLSADEEAEKAQKLPGFLPFPPSARTCYDYWQLFWLILRFCCCITFWGAWNPLSRVTHLSAK